MQNEVNKLYLGGIVLVSGLIIGAFFAIYFSPRYLPFLQQYGIINSPPTYTPYPTYTPLPTPKPSPTAASISTDIPRIGTFEKPVLIGREHVIPGYGRMKVLGTNWKSEQTGLAIIYLSFTCERPPNQICNTSDFILEAIGDSGKVYPPDFSSEIPQPEFGALEQSEVQSDETVKGFVGFFIDQPESTLILHVRVLLRDIEAYFKISY